MQNYSLKLKIIRFFLVFLILHFALFTFHLSEVNAQQISLAISPPLIELVVKPGKSVLIAYKLENRGDPIVIKSTVLPFQTNDNLGNIKVKPEFDGPVRFNLDNSEIKLDQPFFLRSGASQQLLLRIRVPEGTSEGDYYYTFLSESQPAPVIEGVSSTRNKATIGANILITVSQTGRVEVKGKIALFDILAKLKLKLFKNVFNFFDSTDKIPIVLIIDNKGKNMIKPYGEIKLTGNFGEKASYEILPQNILSQSQRQLVATPSASINVQKPVTLVLSGFFIGHYRLTTTLNFGPGTTTLYAATDFIALPFKLMTVLILVIFITLLLVKKLSKNEDQ